MPLEHMRATAAAAHASRKELDMAKKYHRSSREKRKPKAEKPNAPPQVSSFARSQGLGSLKSRAGGKGR